MVLPIDQQIQTFEQDLVQREQALNDATKRIAAGRGTYEVTKNEEAELSHLRGRVDKLRQQLVTLKAQRNQIANLPEEKQAGAIEQSRAFVNRVNTEQLVQSRAQDKAVEARNAAKKNEVQRLREQVSVQDLPPQQTSGPTLKEQRENIGSGAVVDVVRDPSIGGAFSILKNTAITKGYGEAIRSAPTIFYKAIFKPNDTQIINQDKFNQKVSNIEQGRINYYPEGSSTPAGSRVEGATAEISFTPITDKELLQNAKFGDDASLQAYVNRQNANLEIKAKEIATNQYNKDLKDVEIYKSNLQNQINRGDISVEQGNTRLQEYTSSLDEARAQKVEREIQLDINNLQKEVDSTARKGKISKIAIGAAEAFAVGAVTGTLYGAAPRAVQIGADVAFGGYAAYETTNLVKDVSAGNAGTLDVVGFGVTTGAAVAGFAAGSRVTSGARAADTQAKLDLAIKNADVVVKTEGIITETTLTKLDVPALEKAKLEGQIKAGNSVRKIEASIRPRSTTDQALIESELPYRNIEFVEVTNNFGKVIDRVAIGSVKLEGKTGKVFKQDIISKGEAYVGEGGIIEGTTLSLLGKEGEGIERAILTSEKTRGEVFPIAKKGAVRVVKTSTGVKLIEALEKNGRPLTQGELKDLVLRGQGEKGTLELSEAQFVEVQKRANLRVDALIANNKVVVKTEDVRTGKGSGVSSLVLEVPKEKVKKSGGTPFEKTFGEPTRSLKEITTDVGRQIQAKAGGAKEAIQLKVEDLMQRAKSKPANVETAVRESLQKGVKEVVAEPTEIVAVPKGRVAQKVNLDVLTQNQLSQMLQQGPQIKIDTLIKQAALVDVGSIEAQTQNMQQQLQTPQQTIQIPSEGIGTPTFDFPIIDIPFGFPFRRETEAGLRSLSYDIGKNIKRKSKFTASLSSVVGEVGIKVDERKLDATLKKLSKQTYTGFESRPLLFVTKTPKKKKSNKR